MLRREPPVAALSGAGVFVSQDDEGFIVSHAGGGGNFNAEVMVFVNDSLILAATANAGGADLELLLRAMRRRILGIADPIIADLPVTRAEIKQLVGVYPDQSGAGRIVIHEQRDSLFAFGGRLLKQPDGSYVPGAIPDLRLVFRYDNGTAQEITVLKYGTPQSRHRRQAAR